ncbi:MAG: diacylglycerol kinase family protein [Pirellulaceae bacterium]|jgi:diacylglycerol kinase|nr:diacylglycerol kinase family protein [Pirellulaceae bacterium]HJN12348.1 diacylglycerol kinase family protein [Pirellulaceae bacterium]
MDPTPTRKRAWADKFRDAFRGVRLGVSGQSSFLVHGVAAALVLFAGAVLRVSQIEWCLLTLCIANVLAAEMFNSALELSAKAIDEQRNPVLGAALDVASGAVLVTAIGAVTVGLIVFVPHLWPLLIG